MRRSFRAIELHREAEKMNRFSFVNKSCNTHRNLTKFSTLNWHEFPQVTVADLLSMQLCRHRVSLSYAVVVALL